MILLASCLDILTEKINIITQHYKNCKNTNYIMINDLYLDGSISCVWRQTI